MGKNFRPIPTDTLQVIDHWLNAEAEDRVRDEVRAGGDPYPLTGAEKLAGELNGVLESVSDQAALDEELKNAIVTLRDQVRIARAVYLVMKDLDAADWNCAGAVEAARSFGEVIRRYGDQSHVGRGHFFPPVSATDGLRLGWRDLDPHTVAKITLAHRKRAVLTALEDVYKAYQRAPSELDAARTEFWRILEESPQDGAWTTRDDMIIEAFNHWKTLGGSPKEFPIPKDVLDEWRQARRPSGTEPSRHETPDFPADP